MPEETIIGKDNAGEMPESQVSQEAGAEGALEIFPVSEKEAPRESRPEQAEGKYEEILSKVAAPQAASAHSDADVATDAKSIGATLDEAGKIQKLLDLAGARGVVYAVRVARSLDDYYALDTMHDELADKLYAGLLERGLITKD